MKKLIASFVFIIGFSFVLFSQKETTKSANVQHQFGLNLGSLVKNLANKDLSNINQETITYRYIKNDIALRLSIGGFYQKDFSKNASSNSSINVSVITLKWGYEKHQKINKRWRYYYGFDLKYNSLNRKLTDQFTDVDKAKLSAFSVNPLLGYQLRLTPHLFLQTEASVSFFYQVSNFASFSNEPFQISQIDLGQVFSSNSKGRGVELVLPNILFLVVEF